MPGATFRPSLPAALAAAGGRAIARNYDPAPWGERLTGWRWWLKEKLLSSYVSQGSPIVVGGCGRSGTTLLQVILDAHPDLCCVQETSILHPRKLHVEKLSQRLKIPPDRLRELARSSARHGVFVDRVFAEVCEREGAHGWAEKSPRNVRRLDYIFEHFPRARFVHVIRDGRDSVCSLRVHKRVGWMDGEQGHTRPPRSVEECARRWIHDVGEGRAWRGHPGSTEVRYEDLVSDLEGTLRRLFGELGETFSPEMLDYHNRKTALSRDRNFKKPIFGSSVGRWRRDLSREDAETVERICGPLLVELGYAKDARWIDELEAPAEAS